MPVIIDAVYVGFVSYLRNKNQIVEVKKVFIWRRERQLDRKQVGADAERRILIEVNNINNSTEDGNYRWNEVLVK